MECLFVTARTANDKFDRYLAPSLTKLNNQVKCAQVADKDGISQPISTKYNIGIDAVKGQAQVNLDDLILIFVKSNVNIMDEILIDKIKYVFSEKPNVGVLGVVGTKELNKSRNLYSTDNKPVNGILYGVPDSDTGHLVQFTKNGFYDDVVAVDDSMFAVRASMIYHNDLKFLEGLDGGMGMDMTFKAITNGFDVFVADILVLSETSTDIPFSVIEKVAAANNITTFPISIKNFNVSRDEVMTVEI